MDQTVKLGCKTFELRGYAELADVLSEDMLDPIRRMGVTRVALLVGRRRCAGPWLGIEVKGIMLTAIRSPQCALGAFDDPKLTEDR